MRLPDTFFERALLLYVALLPLYIIRFPIGPLPTTLTEVILGVILVLWLWQNYRGLVTRVKQNLFAKKLHNRYPFDWEMIVWLIVSLAAVGVAGFSFSALGLWRAYFFEPVLAFILFVNIFNTKEKILKAISALSISAIVLSLIAAFQYLTGLYIPNEFWAEASQRRATSIFPYPNALGLYLAPLSCVFIASAVSVYKSNRRRAALYLVAFFASIAAILFARSDGALFGVVVALFVMMLFATKKIRLLALGLAIVAGVMLNFSAPLRNYVIERATLNDFSGQVRRLQWRETLKMLSEKKISGAGLGQYQKAVAPYHQPGFFYNSEKLSEEEFVLKIQNDKAYRDAHWQPLEIYLYPHNIFLNFWSELGFWGMLLFAWIILRWARMNIFSLNTFAKNNDSAFWIVLGLFGALIAIVVHGQVDVPYLKNDLAILFWLLAALSGVLYLPKHNQ